MNCKHVQELLPLYVGRDLEEKRAQQVTAHVQSCAECASCADEYRETRQLLQQFAPPPFSDAMYAGIRQRVLREIEQESTAPTLAQLFASLFRPRLRWAVATALLLAVSMLSFYFIANRRNERQQVSDNRRTVDQTTLDNQQNAGSPSHESAGSFSSPSYSPKETPHLTSTGSVNRATQSQQRKRPGATTDRNRSVAVNTPGHRSMATGTSPESNNLAEPDAALARDPATAEKTLRVEMRTKDRNIRIIWFSHQRIKQDSPSKSSDSI